MNDRAATPGVSSDSSEGLTDTRAVALSGGGYRAMLFHLGFLWRLRDAGILQGIERFSSVSGGSITAGMLALAWPRIDWNDDGRSFRALVADPLMGISGQSIDVVGGILGRIPGLYGAWTRRAYDKHLYHGARLRDLGGRPRFTFNATSLHSGRLVRFNNEYFADYSTGMWEVGDLSLALAVAASSAFPPVLSPVVIDLSEHKARAVTGTTHKPPPKLYLADGGVYDNLGIEAVWKRCRTIYASDAGAAFGYLEKAPALLSKQAMQITFIMQDQIGALRFRQLLYGYEQAEPGTAAHRNGFLVASDYLLKPRPEGGLPFNEARALELAATATRLSKFDHKLAEALVNWGYIATDDRLRKAGTPAGLRALPYPATPVN